MNLNYLNPGSEPTRDIYMLLSSISEKLNDPGFQATKSLSAREDKERRIDLIHATMQLEGIGLTRERTEWIMQRRPLRGLQYRIKYLQNINKVYNRLESFDPTSQESLISIHTLLMTGRPDLEGRTEEIGNFRTEESVIFRGRNLLGSAPPPKEVPKIMNTLFNFLSSKNEDLIIKSCMAHFIIECTRPFVDGNGLIGLIWQKLLLIQKNPAFRYLPLEARIHQSNTEYFKVLTEGENEKDPSEFILFILQLIDDLLIDLVNPSKVLKTAYDRIHYFCKLNYQTFTRKDYLSVFKNISSATASRDLHKGTEAGFFERKGTNNITVYSCQNLSESINTYGR